MTKKQLLQKRIDELCEELGITEPKYTDKTTEAQLNTIIDELEELLPDEGDGTNEQSGTTATSSDPDVNHAASEKTPESTTSDNPAPAETSVLVQGNVLAEGAVLTDEGNAPEVKTNDTGDLLIYAKKTFQCRSHGEIEIVLQGQEKHLEEQAAVDAVDAGVAAFVASIKG
ncbi:hypothetical protein [Vibrio sp. H11]|uniref:hypothetical protein n=1 Tax=Vibrio sp. H11 TaxID=2565928 RepID=UPI0010A6141C|nr:hypothetical protein [Vibrio sp. H11]